MENETSPIGNLGDLNADQSIQAEILSVEVFLEKSI